MEEKVNKNSNCSGCGLCAARCPKNAIEMKEDSDGFIYPFINKNKCINCNLCRKVCPFNSNNAKNENVSAYAAVSTEEEILNSTASGGIFTSIALSFIDNGGVVYGCCMDKNDNEFVVRHIRVNNKKDLDKIKGSKYVQSSILNVYMQIKEDLLEKKVLFSGTPCQVDAIKTFIGKNDNLYTADIICHGVPSNRMFNDYISSIEKRKNIRINNFIFRDKIKEWGLYYKYFYTDKNNKNHTYHNYSFNSSYYQLFLDSNIYRESCYNCPYASKKRVGDITLGDYWGINIEHPELIKIINIKKGVSCILINSSKGKTLINNYGYLLNHFESHVNKIAAHNGQLKNPSNKSNYSNSIFELYKKKGYDSVNRKYIKDNLFKNILKSVWSILPYNIKKIVKK